VLSFLRKYWKWIAVAIAAILLLSWVNSRAQLTGKLWSMLFTEIKDDRDEIQKDLISEINRLADERDALKKQQEILKADRARIEQEKCDLENQMDALQGKLDTVVVPSKPDAIVESFRALGLGSARRRNLP
jgi:septal ring factor EnvC (AmiA/AmiB activator)